MDLLDPFFGFLNLLGFAALLFKVFTLVDAAIRPERAYPAAGKQNKQFWLIILGLAVATSLIWGDLLSLFGIIGLIAAIVYFVDVRPALKGVGRGGGGTGPYGPW